MCKTCAKQYMCKIREIKESLEPINCKDKITYVQAGILEQPERRRDEKDNFKTNARRIN